MSVKAVSTVVGVLLLIAILPLPYGYYTFLRLVVFISGLFLAYRFYEQKQSGWAILLTGIALFFNPVIPIYLAREGWLPIDLISAGLFFYARFLVKEDKYE